MKRVSVIIFGLGGVGRALLRQLIDGRSRTAERVQCRFDVVALADSKSWVWEVDGLEDERLLKVLQAKTQADRIDASRQNAGDSRNRPTNLEILARVRDTGIERAIVVDVTAAEGMEPLFDHALESGYCLALANKKALAAPWATARRFFGRPRVRHEATVGGGQPVISTLRYLLDVNDPIHQIEGQLSGTLGFICACLDEGIPFSKAIAKAKARGYTEPDPREDLGGKDVMRKVMILGRMAGWPLEEADIQVESLFPTEMGSLSLDRFMKDSPAMDAQMRLRVETAVNDGKVLRFVAELSPDGGLVGLKALPASSPLANLKYISFRTARYHDEPLLIGGKGAGIEMTAAGVLGDMMSLVREGYLG